MPGGMPAFSGRRKGQSMSFNRHSLSKAKSFLIEVTAFVSLVLVLVKIIVTEVQHLFR